jgi:hypothetical protein
LRERNAVASTRTQQASEQDTLLFRSNGVPLALLQIPAIENQLNGTYTFERNTMGLGILMSAVTIAPFDFGVIGTKKNL